MAHLPSQTEEHPLRHVSIDQLRPLPPPFLSRRTCLKPSRWLKRSRCSMDFEESVRAMTSKKACE